MKYTRFAIVVIFLLALVFWFFQRSTPDSPSATNPIKAAVTAPAAKPVTAQVAQPVVAPLNSSKSSVSVAVASPFMPAPIVINSGQMQFTAGPQADLNAAIVTGLHFLAVEDLRGFLKTVMPPDMLASEAPGMSLEDFVTQLNKEQDLPERLAQAQQALAALDGKTPNVNDAGDRATFLLDPPVGGHNTLVFHKIDGFWYLDSM